MKRENDQLDRLFPKRMTVHRNDVLLSYGVRGFPRQPDNDGTRDTVKELSRKSIQRMVFTVQNTDIEFQTMITLTYPGEYPQDGRAIKRHLNRFLSWLRTRGAGEYVWFLEFQKRGAPHFHILVENEVTALRRDVSERWYKAVNSGDERHLRAGTRVEKIRLADGARRYAAKYGAKRDQKAVPPDYANVGRFWGASRGVKPKPVREYDVWGATPEDIARGLDFMGWEYASVLTERPLTILYNAGKLFDFGEDTPD